MYRSLDLGKAPFVTPEHGKGYPASEKKFLFTVVLSYSHPLLCPLKDK